jgi:hypothetical protein
MESASLTRQRPGSGIAAKARQLDADTVAKAVFAVLCACFLAGFLVFPTYPNYDSYYSLLWGREVLDLQAPFFEGFRVPTEHPLAIAAGAVLALLGDVGDRVWVGMTLAAYLWLVWGIYRLGRVAFTPLIGAIAALLLLTRFDFAFLAARGYIDVPYMAMVVWAAVLEVTRPKRGWPVFLLLGLAGLLRPEAWILAGLYFLWMSKDATWGERARYAAMTAAAPLIWAAVDFAVTGDPLFSLHYTSSSAEDLGRQRTLGEIPSALPDFFSNLVKLPVLLAALFGLAVAVWAAPRRAVMPLVLLASGLGTFILIGLAGLSVIERYLVVAALALLVFAGVGVGGFTLLRPGRLRTGWMTVSALLLLAGAIFTATRVDVTKLTNELQFRGDAHGSLVSVLHEPAVGRALRCGPLTTPNHKLVPDSRWILDYPRDRVLARADPNGPHPRRGVALYVTSRFAIFRHAFTNPVDPTSIQVPPDGWRRVATSDYVAAYARC